MIGFLSARYRFGLSLIHGGLRAPSRALLQVDHLHRFRRGIRGPISGSPQQFCPDDPASIVVAAFVLVLAAEWAEGLVPVERQDQSGGLSFRGNRIVR